MDYLYTERNIPDHMKCTLTLPPTTNRLYRMHGHILYKTTEARDWEREAWVILRNTKTPQFTGKVSVHLSFFLKRDRDVDNMKIVLDTLEKAGILINDSQVVHMEIDKQMSQRQPRLEIEMHSLDKEAV